MQLFVQGDDLGALNLHNAKPGGFGDHSEHVALLFASHAAVAMAGAQKQEQLRTGMQTRDVIGQAKRILMARHKIDGDQAFSLLTRASQATNRQAVRHRRRAGTHREPSPASSTLRTTIGHARGTHNGHVPTASAS